MASEVNLNRPDLRPFDPRLFLTDQELDRGVALVLMGERALLRATEDTRKSAGLSHNELQILMAIRHAPGLTVSGLRQRLGMTIPTFARQIGALDTRGLIERTRTSGDGRTRRLTLSESGTALTTPITIALRERLRDAWRQAGAEHVAGARTMLEALAR